MHVLNLHVAHPTIINTSTCFDYERRFNSNFFWNFDTDIVSNPKVMFTHITVINVISIISSRAYKTKLYRDVENKINNNNNNNL